MRILQVVGTATGGEWFARQVIELARRGHEVVAVLPGDGPLRDALPREQVRSRIVPLKGFGLLHAARAARAEWELVRIARAFSPDVIHYHLFKAIVMGRVAARLANVPVRVSQWPGSVHLDVPLLRTLDRVTMPIDHVVIGSCTAIAEEYRARGARSVAVVHYGLDTSAIDPSSAPHRDAAAEVRRELGLPADTPLVGMVGHMYPTTIPQFREVGIKGHETFISAARLLAGARPATRFLVVGDEFAGDGSYRRRLESLSRQLGLAERMLFLGHRPDATRLMAAMDVVAVPSLRESASYVAMEALLLRRAVVASRAGGLPDTIRDGETGTLVPPAEPTALADAIAGLLDDPARRAQLGLRGRDHVIATFDIRRTVDALEDVYDAARRARTARP